VLKLKKVLAVAAVCLSLAMSAVLVVLLHSARAEAADYRRGVDNGYRRAFTETVTALGELDVALRRGSYANTPATVAAACSDIYGKSVYAVSALGQLPLSGSELEKTARLISTTGDYALAVARKAYSGAGYTQEELDDLRSFSDSVSTLADNLNWTLAQINSGETSLRQIGAEIGDASAGSEKISSDTAAGRLILAGRESPDTPDFEYDGKYSPHVASAPPKLLDGRDNVTVGEAAVSAERFFGLAPGSLVPDGERAGRLPAYLFTARNDGGEMSVEVSKAGGVVLAACSSRSIGGPAIGAGEAESAAAALLEKNGLQNMTRCGLRTQNGAVTLDYAYTDGGVLCYPDALRVTVALDNGEIIGCECEGYVKNHTDRQLGDAAFPRDDAEAGLSQRLSPRSGGLAVIRTEGGGERLCHEFVCEDENGERVIVYIDAKTGDEAKITLVREDENGYFMY
jgi:germination protein YpeB